MAIIELFSKRQKRLQGGIPEVYTYDSIPQPLRVQIVKIIQDSIGEQRNYHQDQVTQSYKFIYDALCREYGKFTLIEKGYRVSYKEQVLNFLLQTKITEEVLDVVELTFKYISMVIKEHYYDYTYDSNVIIKPDDAILELNERFREHGIGYSFDGGEIIRIDSTYIHSEVTIPTLSLLKINSFSGANEEYLKAHEHYRNGLNKECLIECLKAFESTLKIICSIKGWPFNNNDTAKTLIRVCFQNGLVPTFTQNQFTSLQNLLESGIPTIRNKLAGHGQGQVSQKVDDEMTRYGLNLTGTNIIFLIEQSKIK